TVAHPPRTLPRPPQTAPTPARPAPDNRFESNPPTHAASSASHEWPISTKFSVEPPHHDPITLPVAASQIRTWPAPPAATRWPLGLNATEFTWELSQPLINIPSAPKSCCP